MVTCKRFSYLEFSLKISQGYDLILDISNAIRQFWEKQVKWQQNYKRKINNGTK